MSFGREEGPLCLLILLKGKRDWSPFEKDNPQKLELARADRYVSTERSRQSHVLELF